MVESPGDTIVMNLTDSELSIAPGCFPVTDEAKLAIETAFKTPGTALNTDLQAIEAPGNGLPPTSAVPGATAVVYTGDSPSSTTPLYEVANALASNSNGLIYAMGQTGAGQPLTQIAYTINGQHLDNRHRLPRQWRGSQE
jgi:hypothetical protein